MRKLSSLIAFLVVGFNTGLAFGAPNNPAVKGRVVNESGQAIEYATVVLLSPADSTQVTGATSGSGGTFSLPCPAGDYLIRINYLGYDDYMAQVDLITDIDLGDIALTPSTTEMDMVTVTARTITREADRFVVTVANNPLAVGKDAFEMLKTAPGVWISKEGISVNGKGGTRVMVNDRLLRMDADELESYLRTIKAEDIQKIEVIPFAGAEYDADSSGGIIKITLARQRTDGVQGSVTVGGNYGWYGNYAITPSANVSYQAGKLNLYVDLGYSHNKQHLSADEYTDYTLGDLAGARLESSSDMEGFSNGYNGKLGFIYDISPKQSIGAEFGINASDGESETTAEALLQYPSGSALDKTLSKSFYTAQDKSTYYSGTFNYSYALNDSGSSFKLIGDYAQSITDNGNTYKDVNESFLGNTAVGGETISRRSSSSSDYLIGSVNAAFDFVLSPTMVLKTGAKYTFNRMYSNMEYDKDNGGVWEPDPASNSSTDYTENIGALYAIYSARFSKVAVTAGLRGEYTYIKPKFLETPDGASDKAERGYFSLFPNVNVMVPLNQAQSHSLIFAYSRKISRPGFWALNPSRMPLSPYSAIVGNPDLDPTFTNDFSITGVLAHKYSLTLGASLMQDQVMQMVVKESADDDMIIYRFENIPQNWQYYLAINAPVTITKWWTANFNLTGLYFRQQLTPGADFEAQLSGVSYVTMNFALPHQFDIELSHWAMSSIINANMIGEPDHNMNAAVKKRFANNRFTASLGVNNIFDRKQVVKSYGDDFDRVIHMNNGNFMTVSLSLRYNFQAGVNFRAKQVEKGATEDTDRLGK